MNLKDFKELNSLNDIERHELLQAAINQGIINLDDVRADMKRKEIEEVLSQHKYEIWQAKDGRWKTYLPDEDLKNGRRLIAKSSREKLEDALVAFYKHGEVCGKSHSNPTLADLYPEWIKYRTALTKSTSSIKRYNSVWNKWYKNKEISKKGIRDFTKLELNEWANRIVKDNPMTRKNYYTISYIMRNILEYAVDKGIITDNPYSRVRVAPNMFIHQRKPASDEQVFLHNEQDLLLEAAEKKFSARPWCLTPLMIILNFQLGLRIGELVALKWEDIQGDYVTIDKMEIFTYGTENDGNVEPTGFKVVPYVKSEAGYRKVYLNSCAKTILQKIHDVHVKYGYYDDGYIFIASRNKKRGTARSITKYLYSLCDYAGIAHKSSHKIRKTYISSLFDSNVNIDTIREQAGHEDIHTSLQYYCFDQSNEAEKIAKLEQARNRRMGMEGFTAESVIKIS